MTYLQPVFPVLLFLALVALIPRWRATKPWRTRLATLAVGAVFLLSLGVTARLTVHPFEALFPPRTFPAGDADAIVVLASTVYSSCPPMPTPALGFDTYERCRYAAWLHNHWRPLPVLACGGAGDGDIPYSVTMAEELQREGVPATAIWLEKRSRSTYENALYGAALLREKGIRRIALVTDAYHMLRAEKCFRKQGLEVVPAACGYRTEEGFRMEELVPGWQAIAWNEDAAHECVGLLWYWIRGRV